MNITLNDTIVTNKLSRSEAKQALLKICNGEFNRSQIAAFITIFLIRPIAAEELSGFRDALLEAGDKIDLSTYKPMDICGTGGDNKNTFNISTLAAFIVAGAGIPVAKHGNYSVSSVCGSSDLLQYFGYQFSHSPAVIRKEIETAGISFLHAPLFQKGLAHVSEVRKELKVKTFFNMLGPLINPSSPTVQVLGVFDTALTKLYDHILRQTNINYTVIHSEDGYDEISLTGNCKLISRDDNKIMTPDELNCKKIHPDAIKGGRNVEESAKIFTKILQANGTKEQQDVVIINAAIAIRCYYPDYSLKNCISMASDSLSSKKALQCFKTLTQN